MAWIMDTYSQFKGYSVPECVTGKPIAIGGSEGRAEATSLGVVIGAREAAKTINLKLKGATVAVQGYGNVGWNAAKLIHNMGCKVVVNPYEVYEHKVKTSSVTNY